MRRSTAPAAQAKSAVATFEKKAPLHKMLQKMSLSFTNNSTSTTKQSIKTDTLVFGGLLEYHITPQNPIPLIVSECIATIEQKGLKVKGIYRLSGQLQEVKALKLAFRENGPVDLSSNDIHAVTGVLKRALISFGLISLSARIAHSFDSTRTVPQFHFAAHHHRVPGKVDCTERPAGNCTSSALKSTCSLGTAFLQH